MKLSPRLLSQLAALAAMLPCGAWADPAPVFHKPTGVAPAITTQPASKSVATGASVTLAVAATGTPAPTYQWSLYGRPIKGATSASYVIASAATSNAGAYTVSVSNDVGRVNSGQALLSVAVAGDVKTAPQNPVTLSTGGTLTLSVTMNSSLGTGLKYQWEVNGQAIKGATSATYTVANAGPSNDGIYQVDVTNGTTLIAADLTSASIVTNARLTNLSIRGSVGATAFQDLIVGFSTDGTANKEILLRAVGPTLTTLGVTGALAAPDLTLSGQNGKAIASNSAWVSSPALIALFNQLGAFSLNAGSKDDVLEESLAHGSYTEKVTGVNGATGIALAEIYDADTGTPTSTVVNVTGQSYVAGGSSVIVAGFVITGPTSDTVMIRGVGPSLGRIFGTPSTVPSTELTVYKGGTDTQIAKNSGWASDPVVANAANQVGAFPLMEHSLDSAVVITLPPGSYTAVFAGTNGAAGTGMLEIYEIK